MVHTYSTIQKSKSLQIKTVYFSVLAILYYSFCVAVFFSFSKCASMSSCRYRCKFRFLKGRLLQPALGFFLFCRQQPFLLIFSLISCLIVFNSVWILVQFPPDNDNLYFFAEELKRCDSKIHKAFDEKLKLISTMCHIPPEGVAELAVDMSPPSDASAGDASGSKKPKDAKELVVACIHQGVYSYIKCQNSRPIIQFQPFFYFPSNS